MAFGSIYTGTTGLLTFSKGLDVISNNVANLNTVGFKRNDLLFRDLFYQQRLSGQSNTQPSSSWLGRGVGDAGTVTSYSQGEIQDTGNATDVAIDGNGFFILRREADTFYTRAGQFSFDDDGFLVASRLGARVAGIDTADNLVDISISGLRTNPAQPTTSVSFDQNLSTGTTTTPHVINDLEIIDSLGEQHTFTVTFSNENTILVDGVAQRVWLVEIEDENSTVIATGQEIRFLPNSAPVADFSQFTFSYQPTDAAATDINFDFSNATSASGGSISSLRVEDQDGTGLGSLVDVAFDREGILTLNYSNEQSAVAGQLGLAWFDALQSLQQVGNGLFLIEDRQKPQISAAAAGVMGEVVANSIEISNVELSQEFTDLIIVQRGFQASSQVVSVANEMIQQLLDIDQAR